VALAAQGPSRPCDDRLSTGSAGSRARRRRRVGEGVSELRIHYGPGYRVYFQTRGNTIIVLLCGGDTSTQAKDIKPAKHLAKAWSD
jgi:putative addiction module killer protein